MCACMSACFSICPRRVLDFPRLIFEHGAHDERGLCVQPGAVHEHVRPICLCLCMSTYTHVLTHTHLPTLTRTQGKRRDRSVSLEIKVPTSSSYTVKVPMKLLQQYIINSSISVETVQISVKR